MLNPEQISAFRRDGYVPGGRVLSGEQVELLRAELDYIIQQYDKGHTGQVYVEGTAAFCQQRDCFLQITNLRELSHMFHAVAMQENITRAASQLLSTPRLRIFADSLLYKNSRNSAVNQWHQDGPAFDILDSPEAVTAWIALDDVGADDGCVVFATGSHQWNKSAAEVVPRLEEIVARERESSSTTFVLRRALLKRGEVHFHHGLTWHCSLESRNGNPRRGFAVFYIPATTRFNAAGAHYLKEFVEAGDSELVSGKHFPLLAVSPLL